MQQGAEMPRESTPAEPIREQDRVSYWMNRGFVAGLMMITSLLVTFGIWIGGTLNDISQSTSVMATEFAATKLDITELKSSVFSLSLRAEGWASKDFVLSTKDSLLDQINRLKDQVNRLEIQVQKLEPPARPR